MNMRTPILTNNRKAQELLDKEDMRAVKEKQRRQQLLERIYRIGSTQSKLLTVK